MFVLINILHFFIKSPNQLYFLTVIEEIAYHAHMYAQLDKRVESNFSDIIKALEDHRIHFKDILEYYNNVDDVSLVRGNFNS